MPVENLTSKIQKLVKLAKEAANRLEKVAAQNRNVKAAASILANLLVEQGYIPAYKKEAMVKALSNHDKTLEIMHELVNSSKTKQAHAISLGSNGVEKDASAYQLEPHTANYRGFVPVDRTLAGQKFAQKLLGS
jgi:DNA polymerase III delta prime subunit